MEIFKKLSFGNFITVTYYTLVAIIISLISLIRLDTKSFDGFVSSLTSPWTLILFILAVLSVIRMFHCWIANINSLDYRLNLQNSERIILKAGLPGCGKSSSGSFEARFLAIYSWANLRLNYFLLSYELAKKGHLSADKQAKYDAHKKAYDFYMEHINEYVPCLYSNMRIRVGERKSYDLYPEHLLQLQALPYGAVCFIDEIGKILNSELFRYDKDGIVEEMYRLSRHYGFWFVGTEQDYNNVFIGVRRDCSYNEVIQRQKAKFKPLPIYLIHKILDKIIIDSNNEKHFKNLNTNDNNVFYSKLKCKLLIKIYYLNRKLYNLFGYRYYKSKMMGNTEVKEASDKANVKGKNKRYYIPSNLTLYYNDTYCSSLYKRLLDEFILDENDFESNLAQYDFKNKIVQVLKEFVSQEKCDKEIDMVKRKRKAKLEAVDEYNEEKKLKQNNAN